MFKKVRIDKKVSDVNVADYIYVPYNLEKDVVMWVKGFLDAIPGCLNDLQTDQLRKIFDAYSLGYCDKGFDPKRILAEPGSVY